MDPWTLKHAPKTRHDLIGQDAAYERAKHHVERHRRGAKPLLLTGPTGVGKTSLVYILAQELDCEIIEVNASDTRNKDQIDRVLGAAAKQQSLFFRKRIILVDEVDGVSGTSDRGAVGALVSLAQESGHPMIFTANDAESDKLKPLRKAAEVVTLDPPQPAAVAALLARIAAAERTHASAEDLQRIAHHAGGDVRAAITDLQVLASDGKITREEIDALAEREHTQEIQGALRIVLKTTSAAVALPAFDNVPEDPEKILHWLDENMEYERPEDIARAYEALADADRFLGRIRKWQYYRYYVYAYNLLSAGVALAKTEKYKGIKEYKQPSRFLTMWIYNQKNAKRKRLAEQLAPQLHVSSRRARQDVLPYLKAACRNDRQMKKRLIDTYKLDAEACEWLEK